MTNHDERIEFLRYALDIHQGGNRESAFLMIVSYLIEREKEAKQEAQRQAWADREREKEVGENF